MIYSSSSLRLILFYCFLFRLNSSMIKQVPTRDLKDFFEGWYKLLKNQVRGRTECEGGDIRCSQGLPLRRSMYVFGGSIISVNLK